MTGAKLTIQGENKVLDVVQHMTSPEERKRLMESIGAYGVSSTHQRFIDAAGPDGRPWKESGRALRQGKTLRDSARLFQSFMWNAGVDFAEWGTNVIYAGIHQFGGIIRAKTQKGLSFRGADGDFRVVQSVTMPARPYLGVNEQDEKRIGDIAAKWLQRGVQ